MLKRIIIIICLFSSTYIYSKSKNDWFEINLPGNWVKLSNETVQFLKTEGLYKSEKPAKENFNYLFQLRSNKTLFTGPYILMQLNEAIRLTRSDLKTYGTKYFKYDSNTDYLWKYTDSTLEVIIPTETGTINLFCYSTMEDFQNNRYDFEKIVKAIYVNPRIKYSNNFLYDIPILGKIIFTMDGADIFLLTIVFVLLVSRRSKNKQIDQ